MYNVATRRLQGWCGKARERESASERERERTVMHTDRSDVATGAKLCCCNVELCAISVENKSLGQIKLPFICSSTADRGEREITPELCITLGPGAVNKNLPCNLRL